MNVIKTEIDGVVIIEPKHVVRLFVNKYPDYHIINLDKLTYAGNLANLKDIEGRPNYTFVKADICDFETICNVLEKYEVNGIIHLAQRVMLIAA